MPHINSYFDVDLLDYIFTDFQNTPQFLEKLRDDEAHRKHWTFLNDLIYKNSFIHIQSPEQIIKKASINPHFQKLINSSNSGGSKIQKCDSVNLKSNSNHFSPSSVFYFLNNEENDPRFFINYKENYFKRISFISEHTSVIVHKNSKKNKFQGWDTHINKNIPSNALIITDRYLFHEENFEYNLFSIINAFVSAKSKGIFDITLIVKKDESINYQNIFRKIEAHLKLHKNLVFNFSLFPLPGLRTPHDRYIIANYFYIDSRGSFNYINSSNIIGINTSFDVVGINNDNSKHSFLLSELSNLLKYNIENKIGNGVNRLLI